MRYLFKDAGSAMAITAKEILSGERPVAVVCPKNSMRDREAR